MKTGGQSRRPRSGPGPEFAWRLVPHNCHVSTCGTAVYTEPPLEVPGAGGALPVNVEPHNLWIKTMGKIISLNISREKGVNKEPVESIALKVDHGMVGDAHAGDWHRQVSLLAAESIDKMRKLGLDVNSGDFAENITTSGIELVSLPIGTRLQVGATQLEVTQIGKECHTRCAIYHQAGDCVMPKEGIFARVISGGTVRPGDEVRVMERASG